MTSEKEPKEPPKDQKSSGLNDLIFGAIEKIAQASGRLKESAEPLGDFLKGVRDEVQQKVVKEFSDRLQQVDWDKVSKKTAEHLAETFEVEIKISLKPKRQKTSPATEAK